MTKRTVVSSALCASVIGAEIFDELCRGEIYPDSPIYDQSLDSESSFNLASFALTDYPLKQDCNMTISMVADWIDDGTLLKSVHVTIHDCNYDYDLKRICCPLLGLEFSLGLRWVFLEFYEVCFWQINKISFPVLRQF